MKFKILAGLAVVLILVILAIVFPGLVSTPVSGDAQDATAEVQ